MAELAVPVLAQKIELETVVSGLYEKSCVGPQRVKTQLLI